jgi:4-hydroxy-tetrahydrodipicolinate reductase
MIQGNNDMTINIAIAGISGRMGKEIVAAASEEPDLDVVAGLVRAGSSPSTVLGIPCVETVRELPPVDVLIDFTSADSTMGIATAAAEAAIPFVSGVTGLSSDQLCALQEIGNRIPVFHARNFSLGLNALIQVLPSLVQALEGYDIEIVEAHHRHKRDAPSGTALALAEAIRGGSPDHLIFGRQGIAPRKRGEIGIHVIRGGGNAGEHMVLIMDEGEEIRIGHRAYSRRAFALGALKAASFLVKRSPGFYGMADLLTA